MTDLLKPKHCSECRLRSFGACFSSDERRCRDKWCQCHQRSACCGWCNGQVDVNRGTCLDDRCRYCHQRPESRSSKVYKDDGFSGMGSCVPSERPESERDLTLDIGAVPAVKDYAQRPESGCKNCRCPRDGEQVCDHCKGVCSCYPRPEKPCELNCEWECYTSETVHDCDCHGRSQRPEPEYCPNPNCFCGAPKHPPAQRPESDNRRIVKGKDYCIGDCFTDKRPESEEEWRTQFQQTFFIGINCQSNCPTCGAAPKEIEAFIARHIAAAEQRGCDRGYELGLAEWYKDKEYDRGFKDGSDQSHRLFENNQLLTKKIRAAKREVLEELYHSVADLLCPPFPIENEKNLSLAALHEGAVIGFHEARSAIRELLTSLLADQQEPKDV